VRVLPSTWTEAYLRNPALVVVVEVFRDPAVDADWGAVGTHGTSGRYRRSFWSRDISALRTAQTGHALWIFPDALLEFGEVDHGWQDSQLGQLGGSTQFSCVIDNARPVSGSSYGTLLDSLQFDPTYPANFRNRWARVCLMRSDASSYPSHLVPVMAGRVASVELLRGGSKFRLTISDDRMQTDETVPRNTYNNESSTFPGFRAENSIHGRVKPWIFGDVRYAAGVTVVLGYEDTANLRGRVIEFADRGEFWQTVHSVDELLYGDIGLVSATESRGFAQVNQDAGGWVATRSEHSKLGSGSTYGFLFDNFNEEHLYLKIDVIFTYADTKRDTTDPVDLVTDPQNVIDVANADSYATMPARAEDASFQNSYAFVPLPWPSFEGFDMEIEGSLSDNFRDRDMQPPTPGIEIGMYCFLKFDTQSKMAANGAYVIVDANAGLVTGAYATNSADGPARWFQGNNVIDNFYAGDRELYQMLHRDNTTDGSGPSTGTFSLVDFETRRGQGRTALFGVAAPSGEGGGGSAIAAGVRLHALGIRIWGRINFPDDGWYTHCEGYESLGDGWSSAALGAVAVNPLDVLGLLMVHALGMQEPGTKWGTQASWWTTEALKVGKQILNETQASELLADLCRDTCVVVSGGDDLSAAVGGHSATAGTRVTLLPYLEPVTKSIDDDNSDLVLDSEEYDETPIEDVFCRFVFRWAWNELRQEFDRTVTVSPTELDLSGLSSSYVDSSLQTLLGVREEYYARPAANHTYRYDFRWLEDDASALYYVGFLVRNLSKQRKRVSLRSGFLNIRLQMGDRVRLNLRNLPAAWNSKEHSTGAWSPEYVVFGQRINAKTGRLGWRFVEIEPLQTFPVILPY